MIWPYLNQNLVSDALIEPTRYKWAKRQPLISSVLSGIKSLDFACFHPQNNKKNNFLGIFGSSFHFSIDAVNSFLKSAFVETRPRDNKILYKQSKICRFSYEMDRIALFRIIVWRNRIHFGKMFSIFCIHEYY